MVIVMEAEATEDQVGGIVGLIGDERLVDPQVFEALPGVERVVQILHPAKLASRDFHPADRVLDLGKGVKIGGNDVLIMAGPCAVEGPEQLEATADIVASEG